MKETLRIEALSDGVFAIAITLLGLDIKAPAHVGGSLGTALAEDWPTFLAFAVSFATIGLTWVEHHRIFVHVHRAEHGLALLNGVLLMTITLVPFSTSLVSRYLGHPQGRTAAMVYAGVFVLVMGAFRLVWGYAKRRRLVDPHLDPAVRRGLDVRLGLAPLLYLASFGLAAASMTASVAADLAIAGFLGLPPRTRAARSLSSRTE